MNANGDESAQAGADQASARIDLQTGDLGSSF
jgi:hypothetical protein